MQCPSLGDVVVDLFSSPSHCPVHSISDQSIGIGYMVKVSLKSQGEELMTV